MAVQGEAFDLFEVMNVRFICRSVREWQERGYFYSTLDPNYSRGSARPMRLPCLSPRPDRQAISGAAEKAHSMLSLFDKHAYKSRLGGTMTCNDVEGYCFSNAAAQAPQVPPFFSGCIIAPLNSGRGKCNQPLITYSACSSATVDQIWAQVWFLQRW